MVDRYIAPIWGCGRAERCWVLRYLLTWFPLGRKYELGSVRKPSISLLSLRERMWGRRVSDPPVKAGAERRKKTAFQGFFRREGTQDGRRAGGAGALRPRSRARGQWFSGI